MRRLQKSWFRRLIEAIAAIQRKGRLLQPSPKSKIFYYSFFSLRRRFLTLTEILIVISLISIVGGTMALGLRQLIRDQRFRTEVSQVVNTLRLAQQIMVILNTDVHVIFQATPKGFDYRITLDDKLQDRWHKELTKRKPPLQEIHAINFDDALSSNNNKNTIDIKFLSGGSTMSQGVLRLGIAPPGVPDTQEAFICLPGYPHFITSISSKDTDPDCNPSDQKKFNQAITQATVNEITEKQRVYKDIRDDEEVDRNDNKNTPPKDERKKNGSTAPKKG
ncbi:MAG: hypothetical protein WC222_06570 [Parachlamydiales bacterium]|jgi:type II secretory pathway pseudopilin PulG